MFKRLFLLIAALGALAFSVQAETAEGLSVHHPYAVSSGAMAMAGAAFLVIHNGSNEDRTLVDATSEIAARVELHTNVEDDNGVMKMRRIEDGIAISAGGMAELVRGANHIMLMGLNAGYEVGASFPLTLIFDDGTEIVVDVEVMATNAGDGHGAMQEHMSHGEEGHSEGGTRDH